MRLSPYNPFLIWRWSKGAALIFAYSPLNKPLFVTWSKIDAVAKGPVIIDNKKGLKKGSDFVKAS
jgi:hypothetical protein